MDHRVAVDFEIEFTNGGGGALIVSSDLEEILGLSDRILVLRNGRVAATFSREEATQKSLVMAAD